MALNFKWQEMKKLGPFMKKPSKSENIVRKQGTKITFKRMWTKKLKVARGNSLT